ncbi:murein biosynthesis integral membrane protein MurJ [Microbacterium sediminis]|uniref:Murein biosynthesis integral membrane protein MurJ n=1 Tax=Microbacterium sediminis TaxID=904291 RepID=A0A1B9N9R6_9MICO|nr:murein biosynthesis integral membrane protein MurJ [Microbacterium sediminis]OCG73352.1 murein biosynthesis integral membrane protein MurJ [Microbacterium sediminis]QBR75254.1 murein biosynthesis integral membrane protein MurJ [Microbacterium sediminis]
MASLGRSSALIAAGTLASRVTGLLRTIVLVAVIGSFGSPAADAFATANQLPNNIYTVISTGILTAVIVPQIVRVSTRSDGGREFISKLFTLGTVVLLAATAIAMILAPVIVWLYVPRFSAEQQALAVAFAYWCLPQVLFYGLYALVGETLNAKGVFGPFAWAPVVNNVVSIAGFGVIIALTGGDVTEVTEWTPGMIALLAGTATLGIVAQALVLFAFWRGTGLHLRPDFRWRGVGLGDIGRLAGWTFLMMLVGQVAGWIQSRVVSEASGDAGIAVMQNAWLVFMLPYSVIVMAIGTPYFTQLSAHAHEGRDDAVRADVGRAIRTLGLFVVIATAALAAAAVPATRVFTQRAGDAVASAPVLLAFLVCLVPLAVQFVVQRTFYAYGDTRTPFLFTLFQGALVIGFAYLADAILPVELLTAGVALGQALASTLQVVLATWLLRRRIGSFELGRSLWALGRFALAAVPAALAGWGVYLWTGGADGWMTASMLQGALGTVLVGAVAVAIYVALLAAFRAPELSVAGGMLRRLLRR